MNTVLRGSVFTPVANEICKKAQTEFGVFLEIITMSTADIYGGKICAALDRQHPRDFFDIMMLLRNGGITEDIRKAFVVYLASHSRPMNELLSPNWKNIEEAYVRDFEGMAFDPVTLKDLVDARDLMYKNLLSDLTSDEKQFLLSVKEASSQWSALGISGIESLPGIQWKLTNIRKMSKKKHSEEVRKLKRALNF